MNAEAGPLIDRSIIVLESLAALFASEVAAQPPGALGDEAARRRKEALLTISVLIPKLRAARRAGAPLPRTACSNCDGE